MKKFLLLAVSIMMGCTVGPTSGSYQSAMQQPMEAPFFYIPLLNQKDYEDRTWILLAESKTKIWFYDPYSLSEDEGGVISYDAYIAPREKNELATFNSTMVGPYLQKIDCFSNYQWSETFYTKNITSTASLVGESKPVNGYGWLKIIPRTAMAYIRSRICGRKFIDNHDVYYFLYQDGVLPAPRAQKESVEVIDAKKNKQLGQVIDVPVESPPIFYEVINNEVTILDSKKEIRQMKLSAHFLDKDFSKQSDYIFTANCSGNSYSMTGQTQIAKSNSVIGEKNSLAAVAFNRACGNHGAYMKLVNKGGK
jgi:hypothetical protein